MLYFRLKPLLNDPLRFREFVIQRLSIKPAQDGMRHGMRFKANPGLLHLSNLIPIHHAIRQLWLWHRDLLFEIGALLHPAIVG